MVDTEEEESWPTLHSNNVILSIPRRALGEGENSSPTTESVNISNILSRKAPIDEVVIPKKIEKWNERNASINETREGNTTSNKGDKV